MVAPVYPVWVVRDERGASVFPRQPENSTAVRVEPFWERDGCALFHGDCLDVLAAMPAESVDAVITDPPYGIGGEVVRQGGRSVDALPLWDVADFAWVEQAARVLRPGGALFAFTDTKRPGDLWAAMGRCGIGPRNVVHWVKANPPPALRRGFQSAVEVGVWGRKSGDDYTWTGGGATPNVYWCAVEPGSETRHPTQKPVPLMRWLVGLFVPKGGLVLDPFAGSGTTGVACAEEGCRFIGIERERGYVEIARSRSETAARQGGLFAPSPAAPPGEGRGD